MALGVSDGIARNGWRRHRYGILLQEEKVVINGIDLVMQREILDKRLKTHKLFRKRTGIVGILGRLLLQD